MPKLREEDYAKIDAIVKPTPDEGYAVVWHKLYGKWYRSVHVFARQPSTKEVQEYENTASKLRFRSNRAEVEGSQVVAAKQLYDRLIARVYDLPVGRRVLGEGTPLSRDQAVELVPVLVKREAIREFTGEVYAASRLAEEEGETAELASEED